MLEPSRMVRILGKLRSFTMAVVGHIDCSTCTLQSLGRCAQGIQQPAHLPRDQDISSMEEHTLDFAPKAELMARGDTLPGLRVVHAVGWAHGAFCPVSRIRS